MAEFVVVIPARYESERLPGKPLRIIAGLPMLQHVWHQATASDAKEVVIATDDERIRAAAEAFGATVCMTSPHHASGTERIAEVANILKWADETVVVNLQGDEPMMQPDLISECASLLDDAIADIGTLASHLKSSDDFRDPNVVKVVVDQNGFALYFSRARIPYSRNRDSDELASETALHHHGIYAYRCAVLRNVVIAKSSALERCEKLEQLRAMSLGLRIKVGIPGTRPGPGVDTEADLAAVNVLMHESTA